MDFFHEILPCTKRFLVLLCLPPLPHLTTLPMVRPLTRVSVAYRFSSGWDIRIRKLFHSADLCYLQIERINDNEEGTVDMDMLEEKLQVNSDQPLCKAFYFFFFSRDKTLLD